MRAGVSTIAVLVVVVAVIAVGAAAFVLLGTGGSKTTSGPTTTSTTPISGNATQAFIDHINTIQTRQVDTILLVYQPTALVVWTGNTAGLGGTYSGTGNIKLLYSGALGTANTIQIRVSNFQVSSSGSTVSVNATLKINGTSGILGPYNGTITAKATFTGTSSGLKISYEHWNYDQFAVTNSAGATTFPEWQRVGEPITTHRSPDWFHNFSWDYGGPGVAAIIWVLVAVVLILSLVKAGRKPSSYQP